MKRLSDFQDEQALDLLAELFDPAIEIISDDNFVNAIDSGRRAEAVKIALKEHKSDVMKVLAAMEGVPVEEYHCNVFTLPIRLGEVITEVMKVPELMAFFTPQGKKKNIETASGSATESTEEKEQ